ncbi:hypothetical protein [Nitrososphaera sp. AFS]|uniref:hypothetical protein n=1 Tax=Nitrososphaera sp. AFS TaxID=2301191 RepID=UPI0013922962|nr:hypothetical protein [Nitrososphaera sp. AFS]NAL78939.1 hypothetical protein [Nitrososphaera sp. AFS]
MTVGNPKLGAIVTLLTSNIIIRPTMLTLMRCEKVLDDNEWAVVTINEKLLLARNLGEDLETSGT